MKTKLDYYRVFYETARFQSFSKAAEHLYVSQSAISQCISLLESDLGTELFVRSRRGVSLTKEGEVLFSKVEVAMEAIEQGELLMERLRHLESGELSIAAGDTITRHFLLPYLEKFHELYPEIKIEMANSYSSHMLALLKEGKADIAFVNLPWDDDELEIVPCLEIHDVFVSGKDFETQKSYTWQEISSLPLVLLEKNSSTRRFIDRCFFEKNIVLSPQMEIAAHDLLLRIAEIHLGVSCVIEEFSKESIEKGEVKKLNLTPPLPPRAVGAAYAKNQPLSKAARAFLEIVKEKKILQKL